MPPIRRSTTHRAGVPTARAVSPASHRRQRDELHHLQQLLRLAGAHGLAQAWKTLGQAFRVPGTRRIVDRLLGGLGPAGRFLRSALQVPASSWQELLDRLASPHAKATPETRRMLDALAEWMGAEGGAPPAATTGPGPGRRKPPDVPPAPPQAPRPPGGGEDGRVPVNVDGQVMRLPVDHPLVTGAMVESPQSSNVHSLGFDNDTHSLLVRFKDRSRQKPRPHRPGPLYLYHQVPARKFLDFLQAQSKGTWVWDNLRIRGTLSGHQYDYALIGISGGYVPRKATLTPQGEAFVSRTVFTDRNRPLTSTLPTQLVRPLAPLGRPPASGQRGLRR